MTRAVFLYVTAPDEAVAGEIASALIEARLAACVNVLAPSTSVYRWKGAVERARETTLIVKTAQDKASAARDLIVARHPDETPCVAALDLAEDGSNAAFIDWIESETRG